MGSPTPIGHLCFRTGFKIPLTRLLWAPPSIPELLPGSASRGRDHWAPGPLKRVGAAQSPFLLQSLQTAGAELQEHPSLFNHGLCEYADPPYPKAQRWSGGLSWGELGQIRIWVLVPVKVP